MIRQIIKIDEEKCNGCGLCAKACHEGAIGMVNGKARLLREDYCDGLGDCLPACPTGAISFEQREAEQYNEAAVLINKQSIADALEELPQCSCPGNQPKTLRQMDQCADSLKAAEEATKSRLAQWPVQIKLAPVNAPYFNGADLLIAADCTAYAYGDFHNRFIADKITLIGCPKLDQVDYCDKLTAIIKNNDIKSLTVARMEVPCCGGIESAVKKALQRSQKSLPLQVVTISTDGQII